MLSEVCTAADGNRCILLTVRKKYNLFIPTSDSLTVYEVPHAKGACTGMVVFEIGQDLSGSTCQLVVK